MNCTNFPICNTRIQNNYEFENQTSIASCTQYAIPASKVMQKLTIAGPLTSKCNTHIGIMPKPHIERDTCHQGHKNYKDKG